MSKTVVDKETAERDFDSFIEKMDIDIEMSDEDKKSFDEQKDKIVKAIQQGSLVVEENGEMTFTPQRSKDKDPIRFYEPTGATLSAMDTRKKDEDVSKTYAAMADMTHTSASTFSKMAIKDVKLCMVIFTLFLG